MKPKGINFFEQHVEKVVLGVACAAAAGLAAVQFLTQPNAVTIDAVEHAPGRVDDAIEGKAQALKGRLESENGLEYQAPARLSDWFDQRHQTPAPAAGGAGGLPLVRAEKFNVGGAADAASIDLYAEFAPPIPEQVQAMSEHYTLDPEAAPKIEGMTDLLSDATPPYDVSAVHVFAVLNGKKVRENLTLPQVNRAIPASWWERDMNILDVTLERQRLQSDGTWSGIEVVPAMPGQISLRSLISSAKPGDEREILDEAAVADKGIYQPEFLPLADDNVWSSDVGKPPPETTNPELKELIRVLNSKWRALQSAETRLDRLKNPAGGRDRDRTTSDPGKGAPTETEGGPEGTPPSTRQDRESKRKTPEEKATEDLKKAQDAYEEAKEEVLAIDSKYIAPDEQKKLDEEEDRQGRRPGPEGEPGEEATPIEGGPGPEEYIPIEGGEGGKGGGRTTPTRGTGAIKTVAWMENDKLDVWGHDLTAQPGATYRYRLVVSFTNPFFGRAERLADEQKSLATSLAVQTAPSEWTEPVYVAPSRQFFAIDGRPGSSSDERSATFEVYYFTAGQQRSTSFSIKVGEPIAAVRTERGEEGEEPLVIDFSTDAILLDVIDLGEVGVGMGRRVQVVVALEDGSIVTLNPEQQRTDPVRNNLKEEIARQPKS